MLNHTKRALCSNTKKTIGSAAIILMGLAIQNADAVSMKRLNLLSSLGEPFKAEIELSNITIEELSTLKVNIATPEHYKKEGLEYSPAVTTIKVVLANKTGKQAKIILSGTQSTDEPIFDILIQLQTDKGTVLKKFTALLDSPILQTALSDVPNLASLTSNPILGSPSSGLILKTSLKLDSIKSTPLNNDKPTFIQTDKIINNSAQSPILPINKLPNKVAIEPFNRSKTVLPISKPSNKVTTELLNNVEIVQKKTFNQSSNSNNNVNKPKKSPINLNHKDILIISNTPDTNLEKITKKTPQELASILVKSGISDQEQIAKIIQIVASNPQKNTISNIDIQNNPVATNINEAQLIDTPNIIVPPLPIIDEQFTKKSTAIKQNTALNTVKPKHDTNVPWYGTLFGKIGVFSALLIFLGLLGFIVQRFFQHNRRKHLKNRVNQNNILNNQLYDNEKSSLKNIIFSSFYKKNNQILNEPTEFPPSQINIADSILNTPTDLAPSQINIADTIIENATIKSFNKNGGKEDKKENHLTLSDSTTLISKVVQKNNNIPAIIKKPILMTNTKLIIVPDKLTNENSRKQYRLLKNLVDTKPTDLTPKLMFIKFLHKNDLLDEVGIELESLKVITKQQGPQWAEVASIYDSHQERKNPTLHQLKKALSPSSLQESSLNFPLKNDSANPLNLDLSNLTVLMSPPAIDILTPKSSSHLNFSIDVTTKADSQFSEASSHNKVKPTSSDDALDFIKMPIEVNLSVDSPPKKLYL